MRPPTELRRERRDPLEDRVVEVKVRRERPQLLELLGGRGAVRVGHQREPVVVPGHALAAQPPKNDVSVGALARAAGVGAPMLRRRTWSM